MNCRPFTDEDLVATFREYSGRSGWMQETLKGSRKAMTEALPILKRARGAEAQEAMRAVEFEIAAIDRTFDLIRDADKANKAERLVDLRQLLQHAETELACADMIDNQARRVAETARCRRRRDDIKAQIARIEESF
ncbi:hypothetical protein [Mesorhizobium sp.]|uniref:hypothetical protein n=1 Tax=Mesorhizobium sp. TaxID=1871066 RepID=UPI000FE96FE7|nr:hypothetical protein [Mesorhizobium sp.]RWH31617.1 MAG: hypothetical protein EOQ76_07320 [Mesorhizobium sp.]TIR57670.1 MAG: hypothetical protein E5X22_22870 [Mesorhizobium sp.]